MISLTSSTFRRVQIAVAALAVAIVGAATLLPTPSSFRPSKPLPTAVAPPAPARAAAPVDPDAYVIKHALTLTKQMEQGDWLWDERGAPADGPVLITADLKAQMLSVFRGGHEIGVAVIVHGADSKPTPTGTFPILQKDADHVSNIFADAPMPWMLRLTNDGITIHGSDVGPDIATNGCIGLPDAFAKRLFGVARLGTPVIVTDGAVLKVGDALTRS